MTKKTNTNNKPVQAPTLNEVQGFQNLRQIMKTSKVEHNANRDELKAINDRIGAYVNIETAQALSFIDCTKGIAHAVLSANALVEMCKASNKDYATKVMKHYKESMPNQEDKAQLRRIVEKYLSALMGDATRRKRENRDVVKVELDYLFSEKPSLFGAPVTAEQKKAVLLVCADKGRTGYDVDNLTTHLLKAQPSGAFCNKFTADYEKEVKNVYVISESAWSHMTKERAIEIVDHFAPELASALNKEGVKFQIWRNVATGYKDSIYIQSKEESDFLKKHNITF